MRSLLQDLAYSARQLAGSPGFALVALASLALGIGGSTALFSVVKGVLLEPLPYPEQDRLVFVWASSERSGAPAVPASALDFADWAREARSFEGLAARTPRSFNLTGDRAPERVLGELVAGPYFRVLGVPALAGRLPGPEDDRPGAARTVVLSAGYARQRFGGDRPVVGRTVLLGGEPHTVIGVVPDDHRGTVKLWVPMRLDLAEHPDRSLHFLQVLGRLRRGVRVAEAQAEMAALAARLEQRHPVTNTGWSARVVSMQEQVVGPVRPQLLVLFGAVALVLLIACANVAHLLLVRVATREREIAIRTALGAGRGRLVRQFLTESLALAVVGGALGVLVAVWGTDALLALHPQGLPKASQVGVDRVVLAFALGVSLLCGLAFGVVPALHAARTPPLAGLKDSARAMSGSRRARRARAALVLGEVALAAVLLIGAGLLGKAFLRLRDTSPGFQPEGVLVAQLVLPSHRYPGEDGKIAAYEAMLARMRAQPGVERASLAHPLPLGQSGPIFHFVVGGRPIPPLHEAPLAATRAVDGEHFRTVAIPLLEGRTFTPADRGGGAPVAIVNATLARKHWPRESALGKQVSLGVPEAGETPRWMTVVGVVGDVRHFGLHAEPGPELYWPYTQDPPEGATLFVRGPAASALAPLVQRAVADVDPELPLYGVRLLEEVVADSLAQPRSGAVLFGAFAAVALLLACIGVYGVTTHAVTQRTQEIGIRMALGADARDVVRLVLRQGLQLAAAGLALGVVIALALGRLLEALLYGASAADPVVVVAAALALGAVSLGASWLPARRATRIDPLDAIR